ncbi:MAG: 2-amino-4-hydroxy-6-hydroxymethyldihydropteridine diphosphokinase [Lysobacterales bacterium]
MAERAYIGLGSNLDRPEQQIARAVSALQQLPRSRWVAVSPLYGSLPWGDPDQANYVNAVAAIDTTLPPRQLLLAMLDIEQAQGRDRSSGRRNGPRTLDLDLLLYGSAIIDEPGLQLPHPRLPERAFVLLPLADLAPELILPNAVPLRSLLRPEFASLCWRLPANCTPN